MLFIEIDGANYSASFQPTTTQTGKVAMRVISKDAPISKNGFRIVDSNGTVVSGTSDFVYLYSQDGECKVYTQESEEIFPAMGFETGDIPPTAYDRLSSRINRVSNAVSLTAQSLAETNDALCEYSTDVDNRVGELEDSFCEYTTDMDGRVGEVEDSLCELSEDTETEDEE